MGKLRDVEKPVLPRARRPEPARRGAERGSTGRRGGGSSVHRASRRKYCDRFYGVRNCLMMRLTATRPHRRPAPCPTAPCSSSPTAPASPPRPSATRSWRSSPSSRATCAGPSSTRPTRPTRWCARSTTPPRREGQQADRLHHAGRTPRSWRSSSEHSQGPGAGHVQHLHRAARGRVRHHVEPPRRPLLRRLQEPGVHRPHRGDQLLAGPRRRPVVARTSPRPT